MNQDRYTIAMLFTKTDCITQEQLIKYADGLLSSEEARKVELHLVDCPLCDEALEGILLVGTQAFTAMVDEVSGKIATANESGQEKGKVIEFRPNINPPLAATPPAATTKKGGFRKVLPFIGIAASIALVVTLGIFFFAGDSSGKIADRYYVAFEEDRTRGIDDAPVDLFHEGMSLYNEKNYQEAAALFDQDRSSKSGLLAAECYYQLGNYDLAVIRYKKVVDAGQGWEDEAEFKLAMTYLKMDETAQANMILKKIAADDSHDYYKLAKDALNDLIGL